MPWVRRVCAGYGYAGLRRVRQLRRVALSMRRSFDSTVWPGVVFVSKEAGGVGVGAAQGQRTTLIATLIFW